MKISLSKVSQFHDSDDARRKNGTFFLNCLRDSLLALSIVNNISDTSAYNDRITRKCYG